MIPLEPAGSDGLGSAAHSLLNQHISDCFFTENVNIKNLFLNVVLLVLVLVPPTFRTEADPVSDINIDPDSVYRTAPCSDGPLLLPTHQEFISMLHPVRS